MTFSPLTAAFRAQRIQMIGTSDVMRTLGRRDAKSTIALMRREMGAIRDGNRWKVSLTSLEAWLCKNTEPTIADIATRILS